MVLTRMHGVAAAAIGLGLLAVGTVANAASVTYYMTESNVLPSLTTGHYASVQISDSGSDVRFDVSVNPGAFTIPTSSNFGMDNFYFNYNNDLTVGVDNIGNINPSDWDITTDKNAGGDFGKFEFLAKGSGSSRTTDLTFLISGVEGDTVWDYAIAGPEGYAFAAHIAGFVWSDGDVNATSAKFGAVVPLPAAAPLIGSAIGLIGLLGWRRRGHPTANA